MSHKAHKITEVIESLGSYSVSMAAITYPEWGKELPPPQWMQEWMHIFELGIVFFGLVIAILTALWNLKRVMDAWFKDK